MVAEFNPHFTATKTVMRDIAKQAKSLATGLQNAAPPQNGKPNNSVSYLSEIAAELDAACQKLSSPPADE